MGNIGEGHLGRPREEADGNLRKPTQIAWRGEMNAELEE